MKDWPDDEGDPHSEWLALLDRGRAGGDDAANAICDAYSRGIRVGLRRAADAVPPAAVTTEGTHELTAEVFGLEPEQEIRARAAEIVYPAGPPYPVTDPDAYPSLNREAVYDEIEIMATYIRDGSRP